MYCPTSTNGIPHIIPNTHGCPERVPEEPQYPATGSFPENRETTPQKAEWNQEQVFLVEDDSGVRLSCPEDALAGSEFWLDRG